MGGSGMVDPYLYEFVGWDPDEYTGFAFGMGIERTAQLRHGIPGIRPFWDNDLRFLRQFSMKVPMSWLREYVRTDATTEQIAARALDLDRRGERRSSVAASRATSSLFRVGHVLEADKHPNADRLQLTQGRRRRGPAVPDRLRRLELRRRREGRRRAARARRCRTG